MKRKVFAVGFLATALAAVGFVPSCYDHFVTSRQSFQQYFEALNPKGNSLNPVERFVFSLVLANSESAPNRK
ncbi:MAG TPA: hypothetical protein VKT49_05845 [Bryobacteraceae bacterium]|nr:hypothetical protein [Bryobacteraceae bacterium]